MVLLVTHAFRPAYPAPFHQIAAFLPYLHYQNPQHSCPPWSYPPGKNPGSGQPNPPIWLASSVPYSNISLLRNLSYLFTPPVSNSCTFPPNSTIMTFSILVSQVLNFLLTASTFLSLRETRADSSSYHCLVGRLNTRVFFKISPPTY